MAGHSKWANIQHRKKAQDAKRGKLFTKLIRELTVAAKMGGADPSANSRLRMAIDKAHNANLPRDSMERAIKRGAGNVDDANYQEVRYEGYGPGGVAVMVDCMTDNRNRTVAEIRHVFSKHQGNLGTDGSVAYLFRELGILSFAPDTDADRLFECALEAGARDVTNFDDGSIEVETEPQDFVAVKARLIETGFAPAFAEVSMRAATEVGISLEEAQSLLALLDKLNELDDVQQVYSNAELPAEALVDTD